MNWLEEFFMGTSSTLENHQVSFQRFFSLGLTILILVVLILVFRHKSQKARRWVLTGLGISVFVTEAITKVLKYLQGNTNLVLLLVPMQFSSLVIVMMMITVVYRKQWFMNLTVLTVLFAGFLYLCAPGAGMNTTPIRMIAFNSIYTHSVDFVFGFFAIYFGLVNYRWKDIWQPFLFFAFSGGYGALLNLVFYPGASYFYLCNQELRDMVPFMPYEIILAVLVVIYVVSLYAFDVWRQKRKNLKINSENHHGN